MKLQVISGVVLTILSVHGFGGQTSGEVETSASDVKTLEQRLSEIDQLREGFTTPFDEVEKRCNILLEKYTKPDEQGKIYFELVQVEGQSGFQRPKKAIEYIEKALACPVEPLKKVRLYMYWGGAVRSSFSGPYQQNLGLNQLDAAKAYLYGIKEILKYDLPEEKPDLPVVGLITVDGPSETIQPLMQEHERKMDAWRLARFQRQMIDYREISYGQIAELYPDILKLPSKINFRELAANVLEDNAAVDRLMEAIEKTGKGNGQNERQENWGEAVEGAKIGIVEAGQVWGRSDWPYPVVRLKLQARNDGERYLHLPENGLNWQIEVDGVWYEWADPRVYNKTKRIIKEPIVSKGGRLLDFNSGDSHSDLTVEIAGNWRKIPEGKEVELAQQRWGTWPIFDEYGKELIFKEGRTYRIRIAIPCQPGRAGRWDIHRPVTNPVEVKIQSKEKTADINFESLSVEISGVWRWWQKPLLKIRGDGRVEFSMNKGPNDPNRYESMFTLKQKHLSKLNSLLENTGWLTEPGANVQPGYTDASKIDITLHRQGQVKKVWCHDRNAEPYGTLVKFIEQIYRQEDLLKRMTLDEGKERVHAAYQIQDELRAIQGEPVAAGSIRILDYERFVPVCTEILSNTDANLRETIKTALWLLTYLRVESQRDLITKLTTAEQTANDPQFSETKTIDTQVAAINALAALGGEKSIRHIRRLAKGYAEKKVWVNDAIVEALFELDGINSIDLFRSMLQTTRSAGWALIRLGEPAIPAIVDILEEMPPMPYRSMGQIFLIRQYIDHWDNVPKPVDARVINAVQDNLYYRLSFSTDWTQYHQEFLKLTNTPEQKYPDSRQIAEQFLIAIKNDNDKLIRKITHPVQSDWQERLTHLRQLPDLEKLEIVDVCTDQTNNFAWAVNFDINNLSAYDNYVLIILNLTSGKVWQVVNISIEDTPLLAERAYRRYLEKHPNAKQISSQIPTMQVEGEKQAKVQDSKNIILQLFGLDRQPVVGAEVGSGYLETRDDISEGIIYQLHPVTSPTGQSCVSDEKGQIILPYDERRFRYAPRWDIQIYHFKKGLGAFATLTKDAVNHETHIQLRPLCHLHGTLYSSELNKTGHNLTLTNVYVYKGEKRPLLHSSTENHFDFLVPPGQYDLWIPSSGHGVRTKRNFTKSVSIESGQIEMDLGAIDLPASKVSSLIGQPAPEIGPFQTWINGPATQLSDLKGKVVLLHFAGGSPGIPRDYTQLIKLHEEFNDKGLKIIVIHTHPSDRTEFERCFNEDFKGYGRLEDVQFLIAIDGKKSSNVDFRGARMNLSGATHITYEIDNLPTNVLIDQQGMIAGQFVFDDREAEKAIDALLSGQNPTAQVQGNEAVSKLLAALEDEKYVHVRSEIIPLVKEIDDKDPTSFLLEQRYSLDRRRRCNAGLLLELLTGDGRGVKFIIRNELNDISYRPTARIKSDGTEDQRGQVLQDQYYAALLLGLVGGEHALDVLIEKTQDETIDYVVAASLGQIGDTRAIPALRNMLERCSNKPFNRLFAGYGLAMLGNEGGLQVVIDTLNNQQESWVNRRHAAEALEKLKSKKAVPDLIAVLRDENPNLKVSAAKALGAIGDNSALPALNEALKDTSQTTTNVPMTVNEAAAKAIAQIKGNMPWCEVFELTVKINSLEYIDLDTATVFSYPRNMKTDETMEPWLKENGIDISFGSSDQIVSIYGSCMAAIPVSEDKWNCTEQELMFEAKKAQWDRKLHPVKEAGDSADIQQYGRQASSTFLFKTQQGNAGVLQILKVIKEGGWNRKVKIRYWLLNNPSINIADEQVIWGDAVDGIACAVKPVKKSFLADELFEYDIVYKNVSDQPVTVCIYPDDFYVWTQLEILDTQGHISTRGQHATGFSRPLSISDFSTLQPEQTASVRQKMRHNSLAVFAQLNPEKPGRFAAKVSISKINPMEKHVPGFAEFCEEHNIKSWTGVVESGPAAFTVIPKAEESIERGG